MKLIPSALIDTIKQTSGGTTIQASYGGLQLHKKAYQRKKKSTTQQKVRNNFTHVQSGWHALDSDQQATWNAAVDSGVSGFQLYSSTNNSLVNAGETGIPEYVTPITDFNPTLTLTGIDYTTTDDINQVAAAWSCLFDKDELEVNGWNFYYRWSGWINGGAYRYPEANLKIERNSIDTTTSGDNVISVLVQWESTPGFSQGPVQLTQKTQIVIGWINSITGQIVTGDTFTIQPS